MTKKFFSINPANQKIIWQGLAADELEVDNAVKNARKAFFTWSKLTLDERLVYLDKYQVLIEKNKDKLAQLISEEIGKNINDAQAELKSMIGKYKVALEAFHERTGIREKQTDFGFSITRHKPHGVCAVFGPYNFPGHIASGHIIPALISGNTVVYKPSNFCPLFSEFWFSLFAQAGFPEGVLNLIQGESETGELLAKHQDINAIFFTGSSKVGELLHLNARMDLVLALELGGNNALIVDSDSEVENAVDLAIKSAFMSNGQRCTCARRIIVVDEDNFAEKFTKAFVSKSNGLEIGLPSEDKFFSCLVSKEQVQKVLEKQSEYKKHGAKILLEAKIHDLGPAFLTPGILEIIDFDQDEEIFAAFVKIYRVKNLEEACKLANQTKYGLVSAIVTNNKDRFEYCYQNLNTGLINWNTPTTGALAIAPFGGTGMSGNHRPSGYYAADYCAYPVASLEFFRNP